MEGEKRIMKMRRNEMAGLMMALLLLLGSAWFAAAQEAESEPLDREIPVAPPAVVAGVSGEAAYSAIVRIENQSWVPNYRVPWNPGGSRGGSGSGFLVGPNRILTNAHVVSNSRLLYVRKVGDPSPHEARIVHIAHDCDLALLELKDPGIFDGVEPLEIGGVPPLNSTVIAVGYPIGGERISVTRGVVSRIDFRTYAHSAVDNHLAVQIDAAINPGNSGGPVLQGGKVVGVAFQGFSGAVAQNTGYMIPVPVIQRFMMDIEDGTYDHYPDLALSHLEVQNPAQRKALGLGPDGRGVMVVSADSAGSAGGILETGDIILSIDDYPVASDGFIEINGSRVDMNEIVERKFVGDRVRMEVKRGDEVMDLEIELKRFLPYLIQARLYDEQPQFVMFAGLLFQPLDRNLMAAHKISDLQARYLFTYFSQREIYKERPQIVVLTDILNDTINTHLNPFQHKVVDEVNGEKIRTLRDLHEALHREDLEGEFHVIKILGEGRPIVLDRKQVEEAQERIMQRYSVPIDHRLGESLMGD